ncbi:AIR synthase related protein [Mesorhizobium sp. M0208]|uniref:thiamine-phosphate kinase n=1 Tax=Mesorhizobium sp. M0208 TaxID=2956916 RepID=UPI0033379763
MKLKMGDLGERRILREIIPKYVSSVGDDCASIAVSQPYVVITTDPVPRPAAQVIGGNGDLFWMGWLLVTINASDVAAAGARPSSFLAALDLPTELAIEDFERLLLGISKSCGANGLRYAGGNLREADTISAVGTAMGVSETPPLTRRGAQQGDLLVVVGHGGRFWADVEAMRMGRKLVPEHSPVFAPVSQSNHMYLLHEQGLIRCATDTSDGLAPSLVELAQVNGMTLQVRLEPMRRESAIPHIREERFWMGWGDWTVLAAVPPRALTALEQTLRGIGSAWTVIGHFEAGVPSVWLHDGSDRCALGRLESERFAADSWFKLGIEEYRRRLLEFPLPGDVAA